MGAQYVCFTSPVPQHRYSALTNAIVKFINETAPNNATAFIPLTMTMGTSCWFNLRSDDTDHSQGFNSVNWDYEINAVNQVGTRTLCFELLQNVFHLDC